MQIRERLADFTGIDELNNPGLEYIPEIDYDDEFYFIDALENLFPDEEEKEEER